MTDSHASHVLSLDVQPTASIQENTLTFKLHFASNDQPSLPGSYIEFFDEFPVADCHDNISKVTSSLVSVRKEIITRSKQSKFDVAMEERGFSDAVKKAISSIYPLTMPIKVVDDRVDDDKEACKTSHPSPCDHLVSMRDYGSIVLTHHFIPETAPGISTALWDICCAAKDTQEGTTSVEENILQHEAVTGLTRAAWVEVWKDNGPTMLIHPEVSPSRSNNSDPLYQTFLQFKQGLPIQKDSALWERLWSCYTETNLKICSIGHMRHTDLDRTGQTVDWEIEIPSYSEAVSMTVMNFLKTKHPEVNFQVLPTPRSTSYPFSDDDTKQRTAQGWASLMDRTDGYSNTPIPEGLQINTSASGGYLAKPKPL